MAKSNAKQSVRYYLAEITRDLFDLIVFCRWGTKGSKRGGCKTYVVETIDEANIIMIDIKKRRAASIFALNLFLGLSFIGWVASLVWSLNKSDKLSKDIIITNPYDELEKLAELRDKGIITEDEFLNKKKMILKE